MPPADREAAVAAAAADALRQDAVGAIARGLHAGRVLVTTTLAGIAAAGALPPTAGVERFATWRCCRRR